MSSSDGIEVVVSAKRIMLLWRFYMIYQGEYEAICGMMADGRFASAINQGLHGITLIRSGSEGDPTAALTRAAGVWSGEASLLWAGWRTIAPGLAVADRGCEVRVISKRMLGRFRRRTGQIMCFAGFEVFDVGGRVPAPAEEETETGGICRGERVPAPFCK